LGKGDNRQQYKGQPCVIPKDNVFSYSKRECEPIAHVLKYDKDHIEDYDSFECQIGVD
jgi:hypothetical protein